MKYKDNLVFTPDDLDYQSRDEIMELAETPEDDKEKKGGDKYAYYKS